MNKQVNKSIRTIINRFELSVQLAYDRDCTFWACDRTPENNRIRTMITCSRCQEIIILNREIKRISKLLS